MFIIVERYGQLGNKLILFAYIMAAAIENKHKVIHPSFYGKVPCYHFTDPDEDISLNKFKVLSINEYP